MPRTRVLLWEVAMAIANGLDAGEAVARATIEPARFRGIADRVGSLEPGKNADLLLFDGDPIEFATRLQQVIVDGEVVALSP